MATSGDNKRKSLLQEFVDENGTSGLNQNYVKNALKNGGGFGATAGGTYIDDEGYQYIKPFRKSGERGPNVYVGRQYGRNETTTITGPDGVNEWFENARFTLSSLSDYNDKSKDTYDRDYGSSFSSRISELMASAKDVEDYLVEHQGEITNFDDLYSSLAGYQNALMQYDVGNYSRKQYYSQWENEDSYNSYLSQLEELERLRNFDTASAQKELDDLNAVLEQAKQYENEMGRYVSGAGRDEALYISALTKRNSLLKKYGYSDIDELEKTISQKNVDFHRATRFQSGEQLTNDAINAQDFEEYARMGAELSNPDHNSFAIGSWHPFDGEVQNKVTYSRDNYYNIIRAAKSGAHTDGDIIYHYMTDDEVKIHNYYLAKYGEEKADEYLDSIEEQLNARLASGMFEDLEGKTAQELVFGISAGIDQFGSGMKSLFSGEDYIPVSAMQIASQMVREDLADNGMKLPEAIGGASLGQVAYDAVTTGANMLPSILTSSLVGMLNPAAGAFTGAALLGASASGNAYQEMLNLGYDKGQARAYSALVGASEAGLQYLLGGIGKLGGKVSGKVLAKLVSNVDNAFARTAIKIGGNMLSEGAEEYLQEILTPWFENLTLYTENEIELITPESLYSGLLGALTAGFMDGGSTVKGEINTYNTGKTLQKADISAERLARLGKTFSADSVAYQLAGRVNENTGAYTMGRLFNEIGATLTEQNQAEITKSLERKGVAHDDAVTISETLAAVVEGRTLSERQAAVLNANDVVSKTVMDVIINPNSTVNQRTQNYNEALMSLAREKAGKKATADTTASAEDVTGEPATPAEGKVTSPVDDVSERVLEASADGKTVRKSSGEEVKIARIASTKDGKMTLKLDTGETVNAEDVSYASEGEALVYETVARLNTNVEAANALVDAYDPSMSAEVYARGIEEAYRYGMYNFSVKEMADKSSFASELTQVQRNTAYKLGQIFGGREVAKQQAIIKKARAGAKAAKAEGKVHFDGDRSTLNERQSTSLTALEKIADALGVQIYVFESEEVNGKRKGANGWFDPKDSSIHIDLYAGQSGESTMLFTAAHELTHFIRQWSPAKFKVLANFLMEQYGKKGVSVDILVRQQMEKARNNGRTISYATAYEEVVADSMETMLADGKVAENLALLKEKDQTLWGKIKEFFAEFTAKVQAAYKGMNPDSAEGRYVAEMKDALERIQELFAEGLVEAGENYQGAQGSTATDVGEARYSIKNTSKMTIDEQLRLFRKGDLKSSDSFYFGETPNIYGESFSGNPLVMNQSDFKKDHTKKHNVPNRIFKRLTELLSRPIMSFTQDGRTAVVLDDIDGDGKPLVATLHASEQMDRETVTAVTSVYGIDHWEQWISNQSKKQITIHDKKRANAVLQTYGSNASVEDAIRSMDNSVSQEADTVNNKFSLRNNVEETKDLVAVHNLTEPKLAKTLSLGGLPMPSIAIVRARDGHSEFGDISLVFRKETIDPEFSRRNKVYSGDAWTPSYPRVEYKPNEKILKKIKNKISGLVPYEVQRELGSLHFDSDNVSNDLDEYGGNMVEAYKQNDSMKYAYLKDIGKDIDLPAKEADLYRYGEVSNAAVRHFSGKLADGLRTVELYQNMSVGDLLQDKDLTVAVADALNYDVLLTLKPGSAEYLEYERNPVFRADEVSFRQIDGFLTAARKLFQNGIQKTVDRDAAKKLIRDEFDQDSYEKWLKDLFNGVIEKEGIRNEKDLFTPSGNRRSFEALHYENNLENVVKAMRKQGDKGIGGFGGGNIFGASTTEFSSVDQIKQSEDRLQKMSEEEYQKIKDGFSDRFFELASSLPKSKNSFTAIDDAANMLIEAVVKYKTRSGMASYLRKESQGWANYSDYVVDDLIELVQEIRNMPTGYFEAKPQRAVGFDEIAAVIVPDDLSDGMRTQLNSLGLNVLSYENGNNESRKEALNSLEDVKFSDRDSEGSELSKEQQEFFKDSQVRNENGNLLVVYHGARNAGRFVFTRNVTYFTDSKEMADSYAPSDTNAGIYTGYLNITKPFEIDAQGEKWSRIPIDDELRELLHSSGASTFKEGGKWRTTPADIASAIQDAVDEGELDCDGIIIRNVDDTGSYHKGKSNVTGNDYIVFSSNQFKNTDNRQPTSSKDIRYSLREVEPVQPSSDKWKRTLTTEEAKSRFPSLWDVAAEESEVRNPTQISSTVKSYRKIYDFLKAEGFDGTILDASSGLGYGTRAGIEEYGFDVEDIEPYPDKSYSPKYKDYSTLNKKYDVIISNAVLNVLPQDQRDALTVKMGELLNDGGRIFINVRGKDVDTLASTKTNVNISPMEWFVGSTGSYQKGFTKPELVAYLQDALGDGYTVKPTNLFGAVSAVVTKDGGIKLSDRDYSYNALVSKPDMKVTTISGNVPKNRADVVYYAKKNAASFSKVSENGNPLVYVDDIDTEVMLSTKGLRHGLDRRFDVNAPVTLKAGEIIKNAIRINELTPDKDTVEASYVLIGAAKNEKNEPYIVQFVVNRATNEVTSVDVLYSVNAKTNAAEAIKKESTGSLSPEITDKSATLTDSNISIAELLDYVNEYFPDILPEEVLKHYGHDARPKGKLGESALFSDRNAELEKVNQVLEKENGKLREDVSYLKEMLKLQKTVTGGTKFTKSSVESAASYLMKYANARGDKAELVKRLNTFYEYIAKGEELTWESVKDAASSVSEWLMDNVVTQHKLDDYAVEVLRDIRGMRVYLNEVQKQEVAYKYGSFNEFRRKAMGSIIITDKDSISLDSKWVELSAKYPDLFDANTSDANQPIELMDAFDRLRSMDVGQMEYAYEADMIEQDLIRQVYDSYWRVSTLRTVADVKQKEINRLKAHHANRMQELKDAHTESVNKLKQEYKASIEKLRKDYRNSVEHKQQEIKAAYQESRNKAVEGRRRTAMRHKIRDVVNELNTYLLKGTKDKHVMIGLQKAVASALDAVNMDTVGAEERIAKLNEELTRAKTPEKIKEIMGKIERIQAMGDKMSDRLARLKAAYAEIKDSDDPLIANSHDEVIEAKIEAVAASVGDTALRDMSLSQLEDVYELYKMVLTTIRNANKTFKAEKGKEIAILGNNVMMEVEEAGGKKKLRIKGLDGVSKFMWNNLKPVYAFKAIGSKTLSRVFDSVRAGEDTWARDVSEAREYYLEKSKKYGYDSWDFEKRYGFKSSSGMDFNLNLEQIMSLYAYSKREQALDHLERGGIVFDETTEVTVKTKLGIPLKFNPMEATAYNISPETLAKITGKLTKEQKAFVDEMQDYLSTTMGAKGNEVSLEMYGVKLFKEKFYFPLKSATQFMAKAKEQQKGEVKIKNSGFSKETVRKANNPIVLTPFMDVWANHVNEMSMYHAFVLPMEDFYRVFNYKTPTSDTMPTESVEMYIQNAYGKGATAYIEQLLRDLNGGARSDPTAGFINNMMGRFKKGAVFASASVVIQQPSAIARALALVDSKYFVGKKMDSKKHAELWAEVKKYAPVAIIKEMGYFDTNMGKSTADFIKAKEYVSWGDKMTALVKDGGYRDEVFSKAPALADELAWCQIWEAVKRETMDKTSLRPGSEEFMLKAGERFTEVIVNTQVYDSVLSRSANMRSKDTGMKMATAFLAEPTTSINMIADALIQGKRGNVKYARSAIGAVIASQILNAILVSFVYAGRDDDEDETYWEKYLGSLTAEIKDSFNLFGYIPFVKDIVSIMKGYDVERSDISVISDLWKAWEQLSSDNLSVYRKVENFAGSIAQMFGLPVRNIMRDARGLYQTVESFMNGQHTTGAGIKYAVMGAITNKTVSDTQQLYEAMLNDDEAHAERVRGRYKDQSTVDSAIRKALRENDPRIHEAAVARNNGDIAEYTRIAKEIIAEGHFSQDLVVTAINAEINKLDQGESENSTSDKQVGMYKADDFAAAVIGGDAAMANAVRTDIIRTKVANGDTQAEAEKSFASSASSSLREEFLEGRISEQKAVQALVDYCGKDQEDAEDLVGDWSFRVKYGFEYSQKDEAYMRGELSATELKSILMETEGMDAEKADAQIQVYDWEADGYEHVTIARVQDYNDHCAALGVPKDIYLEIRYIQSNTENDKDENGKRINYTAVQKIMAEINSYNLTPAQKTAIAESIGWTEKTIRKYKLW